MHQCPHVGYRGRHYHTCDVRRGWLVTAPARRFGEDDDEVHDELVFEIHNDAVESASAKIRQLMESSMKLDVPLQVEVGMGDNWDQAH